MRKFIFAAAAFAAMMSTAQAGQVWLTMDYVRPYKLERPAQNVIIGNPAIADVSVQDASNLLLYGKAPGMTNIYIMDADGEVIENMIVRVRTNANDMLTFYRGSARTTYNCTTNCEATVTVGDDQTTFGEVSTQIAAKYSQAETAAKASEGGE